MTLIDAINKFRGSYEITRSSNGKILSPGINPWFFELVGGKMVRVYAHEPDPATYRDSHYYNSVMNVLFERRVNGPISEWKPVSNEMLNNAIPQDAIPSVQFVID